MKIKKKMMMAFAIISIGTNSLMANSKQLTFSTTINTVCGVEISDESGKIGFVDKVANDRASFKVLTNSKQGFSKVNFTNINKSENIKNEDGKFALANGTEIYWNQPQTINSNHGETQTVSAYINKNSNEIIAGDATVTTTLEIECVN